MKKINHDDDKLLKELFRDFTPEEAPVSIRQNAMNRVLHDWVQEPQTYQPLINKQNRWWIITAAIAILAISFLVDASVIQQYLGDLGFTSKQLDLGSINKSFTQFFAVFTKIPSLVYFVVAGIVFLLGLDKILNRLANL
nr:hypothetical protein [uncultured Carboxylicivirga sp.]